MRIKFGTQSFLNYFHISEALGTNLHSHFVPRLRAMLTHLMLASGTPVPHEVPELAQDASASDAPASGT